MELEAPINKGHRFANLAEDFEETEKWTEAAQAHANAAEQFELAMSDTTDNETIRTLRLLSANHKRKLKELNRKLQRIQAAANKQKNDGLSPEETVASPVEHQHQHQLQTVPNAAQTTFQRSTSQPVYKQTTTKLSGFNDHKISEIGESYALLSTDDQEDDPFNKFLEAVESLVQQLLNPAVAFTSAPLNENDNPLPHSRTVQAAQTTDTAGPQHHSVLPQKGRKHNNMLGSYFMVPTPGKEDYIAHPNSNSHEGKLDLSKYGTAKSKSGTDEDYVKENETLRKHLDHLQKKLKALELSVEENNMLKSSVLQFRNDVHKQAKRIMQSQYESSLMRSSATALLLNHNNTHQQHVHKNMHGSLAAIRYPPATVLPNVHGSDLVSRLKELEDENKKLKLQNEKQKALMDKYKERWEMLKENAKKRRTPKTTAVVQTNNDNDSLSLHEQQI